MWNAVAADPPVDVYEVYRGTAKVADVPGTAHMLDVVRLAPATSYVFTVRARDGRGRLGPPSRRVRATTPAASAADTSAPTRPGRVTGRPAGSRAVQLSWSASTDDRKVVSYDVYQGGARIHSVGGGQTATVVTGLRPGTAYTFTVRARYAADHLSPAGPAVRVSTPAGAGGTAGTAPSGFRATAHRAPDGAYYLDLSWVAPPVDGVVPEYGIRLDDSTVTSLVWGGTPPRGRAAYSFSLGREKGVTHRVRLRARLRTGRGGRTRRSGR